MKFDIAFSSKFAYSITPKLNEQSFTNTQPGVAILSLTILVVAVTGSMGGQILH